MCGVTALAGPRSANRPNGRDRGASAARCGAEECQRGDGGDGGSGARHDQTRFHELLLRAACGAYVYCGGRGVGVGWGAAAAATAAVSRRLAEWRRWAYRLALWLIEECDCHGADAGVGDALNCVIPGYVFLLTILTDDYG